MKKGKNRWIIWIIILIITTLIIVGGVVLLVKMLVKGNYELLSRILTIISIIISLPGFIVSLIQIKCIFNNENSKSNNNVNQKQEEHSNKKELTIQIKNWLHCNWKWLTVAIFIIILVIVGLAVHQNKEKKEWDAKHKEDSIAAVERHLRDSLRQDSIQRRFNDLDKKFDNRMKQELTFENAYELIRGDSCVLYEILGMINDNPEIEAKQEKYTERFRNRAKVAKKTIIDAIVDYPGNDGEKMCEEYGPKINQIEQMLNSL